MAKICLFLNVTHVADKFKKSLIYRLFIWKSEIKCKNYVLVYLIIIITKRYSFQSTTHYYINSFMNSSNFNKFIEDFSSITSSDTTHFERILRKYPYFQTAALFLAKSNPIQHNTQMAALRSADRRVLRSWLDEEYRQELEKEKQEVEAKKAALEIENDENKENLDINTESINAFDKLVGTTTVVEEKEEEVEIKSEENYQETETIIENRQENETPSVNSFFDEIENNEEVEKTNSSDINFFDEVDNSDENKIEEPIFKEQSDINEPLPTSIPEETTDANFFDEVDKLDENEIEETIFKEQSDINKPLSTSIPKETTDANFFDEVDNSDENEIEIEEPIFKEQSDDNESLPTPSVSEVPPTTTDANFFDEVESDDDIFGDAQKDLDNYSAPAFPDFEEEKDEAEKNKKTDEGGSFFDDI